MAGISKNPDRDRPMDFEGILNNLQNWDHLLNKKEGKSKGPALPGKKSEPSHDSWKVDGDKGPSKKVHAMGAKNKTNAVSDVPPTNRDEHYKFSSYPDAVSQISSRFLEEEKTPDAASEKELGNEYFKKKKFLEAVECYSRSIALSPSAVAYANRAMAYLKIKRFEEAENDCTEALHLDDRYVKAYSRRATARKELGKLKSSLEDCDFAFRLEPNTEELRKQYTETKTLYEKEIAQKNSGVSKTAVRGSQEVGISEIGSKDVKRVHSAPRNVQKPVAAVVPVSNMEIAQENSEVSKTAIQGIQVGISEIGSKDVKRVHSAPSNVQSPVASAVQASNTEKSEKNYGQPLIAVKNTDTRFSAVGNGSQDGAGVNFNDESAKKPPSVDYKHGIKTSLQDVASRAASRVMATTSRSLTAPKSAYEFEVSWRSLSDDCTLQAHLLKTIPPASLPGIFKNALSAPMLVDIVKCTATFLREDTGLAVSILDNLPKVPRFDMIVMCLSANDRSGLHLTWEQMLSGNDIPVDHMETLRRLRPKYCYRTQFS